MPDREQDLRLGILNTLLTTPHRQLAAIYPIHQDMVQKDLGPLWEWLPAGALYHDQNAYLKSAVL